MNSPNGADVCPGLTPPPIGYLLGTPLRLTDYSAFTTVCQALTKAPAPYAVEFANTQIITLRRHDPGFRQINQGVDFFVPDGMPLVWCLNRNGARLKDRVYGPTFMRHCILASPAPYTHYFLGGTPETVEKMQATFLNQEPRLRFVGAHQGYCHPDGRFDPHEDQAIVDEINRLSPDFLWLCLGAPKQQAWVGVHKGQIRRGVILPVGFGFDVNAGTKKDAPMWMQRLALTWIFRLLSEPRRLSGRYLKYNSLFLFYLFYDALRGRAFQPHH